MARNNRAAEADERRAKQLAYEQALHPEQHGFVALNGNYTFSYSDRYVINVQAPTLARAKEMLTNWKKLNDPIHQRRIKTMPLRQFYDLVRHANDANYAQQRWCAAEVQEQRPKMIALFGAELVSAVEKATSEAEFAKVASVDEYTHTNPRQVPRWIFNDSPRFDRRIQNDYNWSVSSSYPIEFPRVD
jgi:hypothetical protein